MGVTLNCSLEKFGPFFVFFCIKGKKSNTIKNQSRGREKSEKGNKTKFRKAKTAACLKLKSREDPAFACQIEIPH